jgi:uncharacterized protein (DUF1015 family)
MVTIKPFAALRPKPEQAAQICELPYDVMSSEEARQLASGNPLSFLHVSKPEIDLPADTDLYSPAVYAKGRENFCRLISEGALQRDLKPAYYLYRQVMGAHSQTGVVAAASCEDYLKSIIKKHELTRPDKEDDRVRHIESLDSQTGPVFLVAPESAGLSAAIATILGEPSQRTQKVEDEDEKEDEDEVNGEAARIKPDTDFVAKDGVRHTSWTIADPAGIESLAQCFSRTAALYIADGHHRSAAAARVYQTRKGAGASGFFLSVIFPQEQVQILPYNRVLRDLNGASAEKILEKLDAVFIIHRDGAAKPTRKHELGLYVGRKWYGLNFRPRFAATNDPIEKLDVTLLQKYVLDPIFGIDDPRTSKRINFIGGIRGTAELERAVNSGEYACAFSMFPTGIDDLMSIADAGGIMPPKSTWFEPKLRDGMFCHMIT